MVAGTTVPAHKTRSGGWLTQAGAARKAVLGPVPPLDRVLAGQPAQPVPSAARRPGGKVDEAALDVAQDDPGRRQLVDARLDRTRIGGHQPVAVPAGQPGLAHGVT